MTLAKAYDEGRAAALARLKLADAPQPGPLKGPGLIDRVRTGLSGLRPPRAGRTLGLMGLGAAGALAYGMHRSNANDRERGSLVYTPMQGSFMQ